MPPPDKSLGVVTGYAAASQPNKAAPAASYCALALALDETGAGGNQILNNRYYPGREAWEIPFPATIDLGAALTTVSGQPASPILDLTASGMNIPIPLVTNATGSDITALEGTWLIVADHPSLIGTTWQMLSSGSAVATTGHFRALRTSSDEFSWIVRDASTAHTATIAAATVTALGGWSVPHAFLLDWGPLGVRACIDTIANTTTPLAYTGGVVVGNGNTVRFNGNLSGTAQGFRAAAIYHISRQLSDRERTELLADWWKLSRPSPDFQSVLGTKYGPILGRPKSGGVTARFVTGPGAGPTLDGGSLVSGEVQTRVRYGTDPLDLSETSGWVSVDAASDTFRPLDHVLTGLTPDQQYYLAADWRTSNSGAALPMPGLLRRFVPGRGELEWRKAIVGDRHAVSGVQDEPEEDLGFERELFHEARGQKLLANYMTDWVLWDRETIDYAIWIGDITHGDGVVEATAGELAYGMASRALIAALRAEYSIAAAPVFACLGNHDGCNGYQDSAERGDTGAYLSVGTMVWKIVWPNPTNATYPEGGENEGAPSTAAALSWNDPNQAHVIAYGQSAYFSEFVAPSAARGLNQSPLQNYFAFTWGDGDCSLTDVVLDANRYTDINDPSAAVGAGGERLRPASNWTLGGPQTTWLAGVLRDSVAAGVAYRDLNLHAMLGGEGPATSTFANNYQRGMGLTLSTADARAFVRRAQANDVRTVTMGHDHTFSHAEHPAYGGLALCHSPTTGAPEQAGDTQGWDEIITGMRKSYGTAESEGADFPDDPGGGTAAGIVKTLWFIGYEIRTISAAEYRRRGVRTWVPRDGDTADVTTPAYHEKIVGPQQTPAVSDEFEAQGPPLHVASAVLVSDMTGSWWNTPPTNRYADPDAQDFPFRERFGGDATVPLSGVGTNPVRCAYVPCTLFDAAVEAPTAPTPIEPHSQRRSEAGDGDGKG